MGPLEDRLQTIRAAAGVCSRRGAEEYLLQGRVAVNGKTASLGDKADPDRDAVTLDGVPVKGPDAFTYIMLHKPRGYITTLSDERGRPTVAQLVSACPARVWPVGRLDWDSEGLLLLTNDGGLTHHLLHPSHQVEKEYIVTVRGDLDAALPILEGPMELDGVRLSPAQVRVLGRDRLSIVIHEGKNRQVRRMCAQAGLEVTRLKRVREGALALSDLPRGSWRPLTPAEVELLKRA